MIHEQYLTYFCFSLDSEKSYWKSKDVINIDIPPQIEEFVWFEDDIKEETKHEDELLELEVFYLLLNHVQNHEPFKALTNKSNVEKIVAFDNTPIQGLDQKDLSDEELEKEILFLLQQQIENL